MRTGNWWERERRLGVKGIYQEYLGPPLFFLIWNAIGLGLRLITYWWNLKTNPNNRCSGALNLPCISLLCFSIDLHSHCIHRERKVGIAVGQEGKSKILRSFKRETLTCRKGFVTFVLFFLINLHFELDNLTLLFFVSICWNGFWVCVIRPLDCKRWGFPLVFYSFISCSIRVFFNLCLFPPWFYSFCYSNVEVPSDALKILSNCPKMWK